MGSENLRPDNLTAGKFYGRVPLKRALPSAILSEVVHNVAVNVPEHSHELAYFTLLLGGSYSERFGDRTVEHRPMSTIWHRAGISHKDRIGASGARCFTVEIPASRLKDLRDLAAIPLDFTEYGTTLSWLAARLYREFRDWGTCSDLVAEGLTLEMLGHAGRSGTVVEKQAPKWLQPIVERLNEEFTSNISTCELATDAGVHPVHLATIFRRFHRQTIGEYLQQIRVRNASRLLIEGTASLADVAYDSGFSDQSHFNRIFKRHTGFTPGQFRRSLA